MRKPRERCAAFLTFLAFIAPSAIAQTQAPPTSTAPPTQEQPAQPAGEPEEPAQPVPEVPEEIEITEGSGFRYQAGGRRDPFVSLALGIDVLNPGIRPDGLPGMLIQEVSLRGIVKTVDGYIAMIQGTDNKSYFARSGQRLYDGNIESIDDARVVFRQEINDPLRIEKFQTVEKTLHPLEEGKR